MDVAGITSRTRSHAEALAGLARGLEVGDPAVYDSITAMAPHVDTIALFAPNYTRIEMVEEIVEAGRDGFLPWSYGLEITQLVMAAYLSDELRRTVDLTDPATLQQFETYAPLIQQGRGAEVLLR